MPRIITLVRKEKIMDEVTYTSKEDHLLHGAILLIGSLVASIMDDDLHGKAIYDGNQQIINDAIEFYKKHREKYPSLT
tara:strand:- start:4358 stop:4591 length:234 start_codon:yes stop_codon:yes gene_type:complete